MSLHRCRLLSAALFLAAVAAAPRAVTAEDPAASVADQDAIKSAVDKSLPLLVAGSKSVLEHSRQCFMCHNQALPVFALVTARSRGYEIDEEHLQTQMKFIAAFLEKNKSRYLEGKGQGGQADMAGYALWTLQNG